VTKPEIILCADAAALARHGAEHFVANAAQAIAQTGRFAVALSGGSTPAALYALLSTDEFRARVDWSRVHLFWGDERCVPPEHPDSNFRMTRENLLDHVSLPPENIHRMPGDLEPAAAADAYEAELKKFFGAGLPRFDLIFLGLGEDGHTASLFPGSAALELSERLVAAVYVEKLRSHRLTLTLAAINAAAEIVFLIAGASKTAIVREIFSGAARYPAARVEPARGRLVWMMDSDAAAGLPRSAAAE
jgi:6-phosphogluconolactonase